MAGGVFRPRFIRPGRRKFIGSKALTIAAGEQPTLIVEVAFVNDPYGALVWTDVSSYVLSATAKRGRNYELGQVEAGTASVTLRNTDGRFDPTNTLSPYAPYLLPKRPIRIRASIGGVTFNVWRGFVTRWPQTWQLGGSYGVVTVQAVDGFKTTFGRVFGLTYAGTVNADSPAIYDRMNNAGAEVVWTATTTAGALAGDTDLGISATLPVAAASTATLHPQLSAGGGTPLVTGTWSIDMWFAIDPTTAFTAAGVTAAYPIVLFGTDNTASTQLGGALIAQATGTGQVGLGVCVADGSAGVTAPTDTGYRISNDGVKRHLMLQWDQTLRVYRLYVNGVLQWTSTAVPGVATGQQWFNYATARATTSTTAYTTLKIFLDEVAVTPGIISASYRYRAAGRVDTFPAATVTQRINDVLDAIGWPAGDRAIDSGGATLQPITDVSGLTPLAVMQEAATADFGNLFIDAAGKVVYYSGAHYGHSYTARATFGENDYPYQGDVAFDYDDDYLYNDAAVTVTNTSPAYTAVAGDTTSQTTYGVCSYPPLSVPLANTADADALAATLVARYKDPHLRVDKVTLEGRSHNQNFAQILGREIGHVVATERRPPGCPVISLTCIVEGVSHTIDENAWKTTFQLSPAPTWM